MLGLVLYSAGVAASTFTKSSVGRVEISPAVKGSVCELAGSVCRPGSEKTIVFGEANVYFSSGPVPQKLALMICGDQLVKGYANRITLDTDSRASIIVDNLNTLDINGNESKASGSLSYKLNIKTGKIDDVIFSIAGKRYVLSSTEKVLKIVWVPSSGEISTHPADELAKVFLRPQSDATATTMKGDAPFSADFFYNLIGSGDADASIDYGDGTSQNGLWPTIAGLFNHVYQKEGAYRAFITLKYPSGKKVTSNILTIHVSKPSEEKFPSFQETGEQPFKAVAGLSPENSYFAYCSKTDSSGAQCLEEARVRKVPTALENLGYWHTYYMQYPTGHRFVALTSPKPFIDIAACAWDSASQKCSGSSQDQPVYSNWISFWDSNKYDKAGHPKNPAYAYHGYTTELSGAAPFDVFFSVRMSPMIIGASNFEFDFGNNVTVSDLGARYLRMLYTKPGTYYIKTKATPAYPSPGCEDLQTKLNGVVSGSEAEKLILERRGCEGDMNKIYAENYWYREPLTSNTIKIIVQ